jgi:hypothetical protein
MRYEISGVVSDTHVDLVDVTTFGRDDKDQAEYRPSTSTITVSSGRGAMELPWDAHPMLKVGTPVTFIVEVHA